MKTFRAVARAARLLVAMLIVAAASLSMATAAQAQASNAASWPTRPVKFIVPFGAGSAVDVGARLLADKLSQRWGQAVVIDNRPGGDGIIAMSAFLNANDDHVLLYSATGSYTIHPFTTESRPYDFARDLVPIARVANTILAATAPASSDIRTLKDLVARARAEPGKLNGAAAQGITEMVFDGFVKSEGLSIEKVPYKDIVQAVPDLIAGRLNVIFASYATVLSAVSGGGARVLAIGARERAPNLPDTPTAREAGVPSLELEGLSGIFGPVKISAQARKRIGDDVIDIMKDPMIVKRLIATGQTPAPGGPDDLARSVQMQTDQVAALAKLLGMTRKP